MLCDKAEDLLRQRHITKEAVKAHVKQVHGMTWEEARGMPPQFVDDGPKLHSTKWLIKVQLELNIRITCYMQ